MQKSCEQQARDLLEQCGVEDAQSFTAGDVVALANFINDAARVPFQIRRIHFQDGAYCRCDGAVWPCPTIRVLDGGLT